MSTTFTKSDFDAAMAQQGFHLVEGRYVSDDLQDQGLHLYFSPYPDHAWAELSGELIPIHGHPETVVAAVLLAVPEGVTPPSVQDESGEVYC